MAKDEPASDELTLFNAFMDNIPSICFMFNAENQVVYVNPEGLSRFGWKTEDVFLRKATDIFGPAVAEEIEAENLQVLETGKTLSKTKILPTPDESGIVWHVTKFLFVDQLGNRYVGGFAVDVTELDSKQRQLEELAKILERQKQELVEVNLSQETMLLSMHQQMLSMKMEQQTGPS